MKRWLIAAAMTLPILSACSSSSGPNPVVVIETSMGTIKAELFQDKSPVTVRNFLAYVDDKFYDGTIFHRVMPDFMVQGGGFEPGMKEKRETKGGIKNESANGVKNERGTLAMARLGPRDDTPVAIQKAADSATAQFFINVKDNEGLDRARAPDRVGYAVFGKVIEGMDVVDQIKAVRTTERGDHENVPVEDVVIKSIRRVQAKETK